MHVQAPVCPMPGHSSSASCLCQCQRAGAPGQVCCGRLGRLPAAAACCCKAAQSPAHCWPSAVDCTHPQTLQYAFKRYATLDSACLGSLPSSGVDWMPVCGSSQFSPLLTLCCQLQTPKLWGFTICWLYVCAAAKACAGNNSSS